MGNIFKRFGSWFDDNVTQPAVKTVSNALAAVDDLTRLDLAGASDQVAKIEDNVKDSVVAIGDAIGDAGAWIDDTAHAIVQNALDDPVKFALQAGVIVATGGAGAAALGMSAPLTAMQASLAMAGISAGSTLAKGGDFQDALESGAKSFAISQAVSFGMDAIGVGADAGSVTAQYNSDGSFVQTFEDGSQMFTDASGQISMEPATEALGAEVAGEAAMGNAAATDIAASGAEDAVMQAASGAPAATANAGDVAAEAAQQGVKTAIEPVYESLPDSYGNAVAVEKSYSTIEDLMYDKGAITAEQYKELTGVAPVVDLSGRYGAPPDVPLSEAALGYGKELGGKALDFALENPLTTLGLANTVMGGGLFGGGQQQQPNELPQEEERRTYTYSEVPKSPPEVFSKTDMRTYDIQPRSQVTQPQQEYQFNPQALLQGQAEGNQRFGLGALGQGFAYTPIGSAKSYDISQLTPEQIVRLQEATARR